MTACGSTLRLRPEHAQNRPETVWTLQLPQLRFGRDAIAELPHQLLEIDVVEPASGVLITDETIAEFGHAARYSKAPGSTWDRLDARDAADAAKETYIQLQRDLNVVPSGLNELTGATENLAQQCLAQQKRLVRCHPRLLNREAVTAVYQNALHNWDS